MKISILTGGLLLFCAAIFAQKPCDPNELATRPGKWKEGMKGSTMKVQAKDAAAEMVVMNKLNDMIKTGYKPVGLVLHHSNVIGYNDAIGSNWICHPYANSIALIDYFCENGKEKVNGENEAQAGFFLYANSMEWIANIYGADLEKENENGYVPLLDMPTGKNGIYYFTLKDEFKYHKTAVLITKEDVLPFSYVTRKEFLNIRRAKLEKKRAEEMAKSAKSYTVRPKAEQEAAKQKEIADLKRDNYSQPYIDRFLKDYQTDEQKRDAGLQRTSKYYDEPLKLINELLSNSSEKDLSQPAIIKGQDEYDVFTGFVTDDKGVCLVKPNRAYYNKSLPKTAPQFFSVFYSWSDQFPVSAKGIEGIRKSLDYEQLKGMIVR